MQHRQPARSATLSQQSRTRGISMLGLAAIMATGVLLSGCNTTAGAGRDVSATGAAVTRGADDVKKGL